MKQCISYTISMEKNIKLIIGLGNPDPEYTDTYHNVGHLFIDFLSSEPNTKYQLLKSPYYMNRSGEFVKEEMKHHQTKPENLLVAHDDSDLTLGSYKLSFGRGSAGHKAAQLDCGTDGRGRPSAPGRGRRGLCDRGFLTGRSRASRGGPARSEE